MKEIINELKLDQANGLISLSDFTFTFCLTVSIIAIIAFFLVFTCIHFDIYLGDVWYHLTRTLPEQHRMRKAVRKHKQGDMSEIIKLGVRNAIDPKGVVCRDISNQDVLDANLSILHYTLLAEDKPVTWAEKVRELARSSCFSEHILPRYLEHDDLCVLPDPLLEAMLLDKKALYIIDSKNGLILIDIMATAGHKTAKDVVALAYEIKHSEIKEDANNVK